MKACGKIILFGEHAVVYGQPGIAIPVKEINIDITPKHSETLSFSLDRELLAEEKIKVKELLDFLFFRLDIPKKCFLSIESTIPLSSGLGSSASLSIAMIRTLAEFFDIEMDKDKMNELAFECEKIFHGNPSGIDNTVINYEKPVFFKRDKTDFLSPKKELTFLIVDSDIRSSTKEVIEELRKRYEENKNYYIEIFEDIGKISQSAKPEFEKGNIDRLGKLMTENHDLLKLLRVSHKKLDEIVETALEAGAYGAKLAGAGKGGNVIILVDDKNKDKVKHKLERFGNIILTNIK